MRKVSQIFNPFYSFKSRLKGIVSPLDKECCKLPLSVKGSIPRDIIGSYYRNGPNQKFTPFSNHHLVDGHGMLHHFKISDGQVTYTNRWIDTKLYLLENKFRSSLTGGFLNPFESDARTSKLSSRERTKSNTNVFQLQGKVLTFEEGGIPYIISQKDLSTIGIMRGVLPYNTTVTGHPKYDQNDGKLYCLNWNIEPQFAPCTFFTIDCNNNCENFKNIPVPYRSMIHDFAITKNYILLPIFPCIVKYKESQDSKAMFEWMPELGAKIGLIDKKNFNLIKWFELDLFYAMHTCNAYESEDQIVLDLIAHDEPPILINEKISSGNEIIRSQLMRITLDLNTGKHTMNALDDNNTLYSFPRINDSLLGRKHRYIYATATSSNKRADILYNKSLVAFDTKTNEKHNYVYGAHWYFGEPVFVPTQKDDYILTLISSPKFNRSKLLVFNAYGLQHGPIAEVTVPHMIPYGFHGHWQAENLL